MKIIELNTKKIYKLCYPLFKKGGVRMFHLIELVKLRNCLPFAYHLASDNVNTIKTQHDYLSKKFNNYSISSHILTTDEISWMSIVHMDPYFNNVKFVESVEEFNELLLMKTQISSNDVCALILNKIDEHIDNFKLEKLLYFVYCDFLEKYHQKLFPQNFNAWEFGPVESISRHNRIDGKLPSINDAFYKILMSNKSDKFFSSFEEVMDIYGSKTSDELIELTHRIGSPWQRKYVKNQNVIISDDDILAFHQIEKLDV